jgi:capsular exopolysaccharide synthesis family protein
MTDNINISNTQRIKKTKEKSIFDLLRIIYRRRYILIGCVLGAILLAIIYNSLSTPVYQASVLLKKEAVSRESSGQEVEELLALKTRDEVETEMELVKTWSVLGKVIDDLNLFLKINKVVTTDGQEHKIEKSAVDFNNPENLNSLEHPFPLPKFGKIQLKNRKEAARLYVVKTGDNSFELYNGKNDVLITKSTSIEATKETLSTDQAKEENPDTKASELTNKFTTALADFDFSWPTVPAGTKVYFEIENSTKVLQSLDRNIIVERKAKTNVFEVSVRSSTPYSALIIANTLVDKFRESRIYQQKETIRYSFNFVDQQLTEVQDKLKEAENNLSSYKSSGQVMAIDESSRELIQFLTSMEAEKFRTELQLADYTTKLSNMKKELSESGYFDQSYLSPTGTTEDNTPFSSLMRQLSDLELQRLDLLQKRTENHPDVRNLDEQIQLVRNKLATYNQNTLTAYQIIINSLEEKSSKINSILGKYEGRMASLPARESQLAGLMRQKDVFEKIFTLLLDKREEMRMAELSKLQDIAIVDPAFEPLNPVSPKTFLNVAVGLLIGLLLGILGVFIAELKAHKLVKLDELEEAFNIPIMAIIPSFTEEIKKQLEKSTNVEDKFVTMMEEEVGVKETFRLLKTKIMYEMEGREKLFLVTSCEEGTGKTTTVGNLAVSIAQENKKVLVIDCDLRKASLSRMFDVPNEAPGLIEFLSKDVAPTIYTRVLKKIDILPAGGIAENSSDLLNSERMMNLLKAIDTSQYDYILIDTPPVTRVVDTLVLGRYVKDVLLVVRPNHSFKESVYGGIQDLLQAKMKIHGIVANAAEIEQSSYRYRYGYGYGYSYGKDASSRKKVKLNEVLSTAEMKSE